MASVENAQLNERRMVATGLRSWIADLDEDVRGLTAAAVELVIRVNAGEFADLGWPWVRESDELGLFWLDVDAMTGWNSGRPEHPVMDFVEALAGGRPARPLAGLLRWLDQEMARLVLCAFDHAAAGAGREVALYAFGGDPHQLVQRPAEPTSWPVDVPDRLDRRPVHLAQLAQASQLRVAGVGR